MRVKNRKPSTILRAAADIILKDSEGEFEGAGMGCCDAIEAAAEEYLFCYGKKTRRWPPNSRVIDPAQGFFESLFPAKDGINGQMYWFGGPNRYHYVNNSDFMATQSHRALALLFAATVAESKGL